MKLRKFILMLVSSCAAVCDCYAQEPLANLTVEVIDSVGLPVDHATVVLYFGGPDGKYEVVDNKARVPLGHYVLRVEASGFASQEHRLRILHSSYYFRVALDISDVGAGHTNRVSGSIRGKLPQDQDVWVRLLPFVTRSYSDMDYKISRGGRFEFVGMPNGEYLLLVLGGCRNTKEYPKLLTTKKVSVWGRATVNLAIDENHRIEPCADRTSVK